MRVANLDMTNTSHQCPPGLKQGVSSQNQIACAPYTDSATCSSVMYTTNRMKYSRVCGSILGYSVRTTDGFNDYGRGTSLTLNSNYVDGVSLTHGKPNRHHIWTFAGLHSGYCTFGSPPAFINNEYFCDHFRGTDATLWNNRCSGCACCHLHNPPWFHKQLPQPTTDDIEMRLCRDQQRSDEDVMVYKVEIYVL